MKHENTHRSATMSCILSALSATLLMPSALAQDATQTDGDKYKTILENECVRVLEYRDEPGAKTHQHHHPAFVLYALSSFERTLTLPDGKVLRRKFKAGDVMWSEAQTHIGENVGKTATHVLITELKKSLQGGQECARR
jgi:quercetin dioxygenase-like cupin family protein